MGCGACATVCPSGAMSYALSVGARSRRADPHAARDLREGRRPRRVPAAARRGRPRGDREPRAPRPRAAGARHPVRGASRRVGRARRLARARSRTARAQVAVLATGAEAPQYREALERADGLRRHDRRRRSATRASISAWSTPPTRRARAALWSWPPALAVRVPATFAFTADKRTTAALAIEHLARHAPVPQREIALPAGAPFGTIAVNRDACTMCLACVGACPEGAILDNQEAPQLSLHRDEVRAVRPLRGDLPRARDHARRRGSPSRPRRGSRACSTRRSSFNCIALRQAARHREDDRQHAGEARRAFDVRRARRARPAQDVRRLPRRSTS